MAVDMTLVFGKKLVEVSPVQSYGTNPVHLTMLCTSYSCCLGRKRVIHFSCGFIGCVGRLYSCMASLVPRPGTRPGNEATAWHTGGDAYVEHLHLHCRRWPSWCTGVCMGKPGMLTSCAT